jgi:hypothetical protein
MKKILYILSVVSLFAVGCTKEIPVSKDHDIDAEVTELETALNLTALYCNINDSESVDLQKLGEYIVASRAKVVTFVAPATVKNSTDAGLEDVNFAEWLSTFVSSESTPLSLHYTATRAGNSLVMAAAIAEGLTVERKSFNYTEPMVDANPVLHFEVEGLNFVVTEMKDSRLSIPEDWETQVDAMKNTTTPLTYDEANRNTRKSELGELLLQTINKRAYMDEHNWVFCVDMNVASKYDISKYAQVFPRRDCYKDVTDEFLAKKTAYYSVSENLDASDGYFALCEMMSKNLLDCALVQYSVYMPSSVDGSRHNFLYSTSGCWNMFQGFKVDTKAALGTTHYPILVTIKSEQ